VDNEFHEVPLNKYSRAIMGLPMKKGGLRLSFVRTHADHFYCTALKDSVGYDGEMPDEEAINLIAMCPLLDSSRGDNAGLREMYDCSQDKSKLSYSYLIPCTHKPQTWIDDETLSYALSIKLMLRCTERLMVRTNIATPVASQESIASVAPEPAAVAHASRMAVTQSTPVVFSTLNSAAAGRVYWF